MVVPNPYKNPYRKRPRAEQPVSATVPYVLQSLSSNLHAAPVAIQATATCSNNLNESFDDGGIDWNSAFEQMDQVASQQAPPPRREHSFLVPAVATSKTTPVAPVAPSKALPTSLQRPEQWTSHPIMQQPVPQKKCADTASEELPRLMRYDAERTKPPQDDLRRALVKNARIGENLNNGWTLFSHQKKAILRALIMRRIIMALDMGLGKTIVGVVWGRAFRDTYGADELKILCICPVSLMKEWKRTAEEAAGLEVQEINTKKKPDPDSLEMAIHSWSKVPDSISASIKNYVIICDEAHYLQSMESGRTKQVLKLANSPRCVGVLLLTGTPMKNGKPCNLFPLLKAVKHPFGDHKKAYETHFCNGMEKSFGRGPSWDASGCSNLGQLRKHIASHLLHMTKEVCLANLPPKTRTTRQVQVSSRHQLQHNQALNELAKTYSTRGSGNSGDAVLTAVTRVRQIGSFAKIDATVAIVKEILQEQSSVVIFSSFATVAKTVHSSLAAAGWAGELLTGETPSKKRQDMVDNFQEGLSPVFVSTFGAGGVGLTLTAAHTIILLDRPWTPGDANQAEDRVRRIGQTKPVTSIWMVAFDLDKQIDSLLKQKENTTQVVLADGDEEKLKLAGAAKISIMQLLKSVLGPGQMRQTTL